MNVVLIVVDGLQVAALGAYGDEWTATPNFDRLATESVVFDQHFADAPSAELLRARHAFPPHSPGAADSPPSGLRRLVLPSLRPPWNPPEKLLSEEFDDWEFENEPDPWLDPPAGWLDQSDEAAFAGLQRTYAAAVRQFDAKLGASLKKCSPEDVLILAGARGLNLGEHGLIGDMRPWLHEELVHVPLVIRLPGAEQAGRRVQHLTQSVDLLPTVLDALSHPPPEAGHGHSLLPLCRGAGPVRSFVCMGLQTGDTSEYALQTLTEKVIVPVDDPVRQPMYFVKPDDRGEVNDLRQSNLDYAEQLERTLQLYVEASAKPGALEAPPLPPREY